MAAPRSLFAELSVIFAVMCFLSYRFVSAKPNWVDSVCLVGAVIAFVFWMLTGGAIRWMLPSVVLLGMAFAYTKFVRHGHFQKAAGAK
jgi:uncharacterized BrkB/YihY/UPF0761 family membrane protein